MFPFNVKHATKTAGAFFILPSLVRLLLLESFRYMPKKDIRHSEYPHSDSHQFKPFKVTLFQVGQNLCLPIEYKLSIIDKSISQPEPQ